MQDLVTSSHQHCFMPEAENFLEDSESLDVEECGTENVVRVRVRVIQSSFKPVVSEAIDKMTAAKLVIDHYGLDGTSQETRVKRTNEDVEPRLVDKLTVLINDISIAMRKLNYAITGILFIGSVKAPSISIHTNVR